MVYNWRPGRWDPASVGAQVSLFMMSATRWRSHLDGAAGRTTCVFVILFVLPCNHVHSSAHKAFRPQQTSVKSLKTVSCSSALAFELPTNRKLRSLYFLILRDLQLWFVCVTLRVSRGAVGPSDQYRTSFTGKVRRPRASDANNRWQNLSGCFYQR